MKYTTTNKLLLFVLVLFSILSQSCLSTQNRILVQRDFLQVEDLDDLTSKDKYIKAHLTNGEIYVLKKWEVQDSTQIRGLGIHYDINRKVLSKRLIKTRAPKSEYYIDLASIDFFERNLITGRNNGDKKILIMTGITGIVGVLFWGIVINGF